MKTFTDAAGRTWTITLNLGTAMKVRPNSTLICFSRRRRRAAARLGTDELLLGEVFALCSRGSSRPTK